MTDATQRDIFWQTVYESACQDPGVVIISADMGAPALDLFRRDLPGQFVNVGIAEQNAVTLATGLALTGKRVFVYAIAPFITLRCLEQIRVGNAIMGVPVTIVGVGAGFGYQESGPTHHALEDIAVMRTLPHVRIHNISDGVMAGYFAKLCCSGNQRETRYVRLDRLHRETIYDEKTDFSKGLSLLRKKGKTGLVATGAMTHTALAVAEVLAQQNLPIGVIDLFDFPINETEFLERVQPFSQIITLEENFLAGGMGSAVLELLNDHQVSLSVHRIGLAREKGYSFQYGDREDIRRQYGVDYPSLLQKIARLVKNHCPPEVSFG